jgi:hypothetical protein
MRFVGWALAFVLALGAAAYLAVTPNDALAQSEAVDNGTAETVAARLDAHLDKNVRSRAGKPNVNGADEWRATCHPEDQEVDVPNLNAFDVPGRGELLGEWDGKTVTCYLWADGTVIAIKGPDGTLLKSETVGWRGAVSRWTAAAFTLGAALLIGATKLRMGVWTGVAGGALIAVTLLVVLHLTWLWVGVAADVAMVLALVWFVVGRLRRAG